MSTISRKNLKKISTLIDKRVDLLKKLRDVRNMDCVGLSVSFSSGKKEKCEQEVTNNIRTVYWSSVLYSGDGAAYKELPTTPSTSVNIPPSDTVKAFVIQYIYDQLGDIDVELMDLGITFEEYKEVKL